MSTREVSSTFLRACSQLILVDFLFVVVRLGMVRSSLHVPSSRSPLAPRGARTYVLHSGTGDDIFPSKTSINVILTCDIHQVATMDTYNYHPPLAVPDSEAPEQSLGDCAICMDAISVDRSFRDEKSEGSLLSKGALWAQGARKNYSLAPCHHLFVSLICFQVVLNVLIHYFRDRSILSV